MDRDSGLGKCVCTSEQVIIACYWPEDGQKDSQMYIFGKGIHKLGLCNK